MRIFCSASDIRSRSATLLSIALKPDEAKHFIKVLRLAPGDRLTIVMPDQVADVELRTLNREGIEASVLSVRPPRLPSGPTITLVQALPKQDKFSEILRACTEIGVAEFIPIQTQRCVSKPGEAGHKFERWQSIIHSAAVQSQQDRVPRLQSMMTLEQLAKLPATYDLKLVCWEEESETTLASLIKTISGSMDSVLVLIGPEGGLDAREIQVLAAHGFKSVKLTMPILRVEHAALVAISQIKMAGEMR